jgi:MFS family permease
VGILCHKVVAKIMEFTSSLCSLYLDPLHQTFPESGSGALALVCTIQIVAALASSLAGGIAQDALASADIGLSWLFFSGGVFMCLGLVWSSYASTVMGVMIGSVSLGIGLGLAGLMSAGMCVLWFEQSRGTMLLLAISGQGVGNLLFPFLIVKLLETFDEVEDPWRPTMRWMGLLSFVVCAMAAPPMRLPFPGEVEENEKDIATSDEITPFATDKNYGSMVKDSNYDNLHQRRRRSSVVAFEKLRAGSIGASRLRSSIVDGVASGLKRSSVVGAYQAVSTAPYFNSSDLGRRSTIFARTTNVDVDPIPEGNRESYFTLKDVAFSSTNLWLSAFTFIACFASLNAQVLIPKYCLSLGFPEAVGGFAMALYGLGVLMANLTLGVAVDRVGARKLLSFGFATMAMLFFIWPLCITASLLVWLLSRSD